jgi:anthranilate phosphoribosyltransferase
MEKLMSPSAPSEGNVRQELASHIAAGADFMQLHALLAEYKRRGLTAAEIADVLEQLRRQMRSESDEDRVLELLDIAHGFCSPHLTIWG